MWKLGLKTKIFFITFLHPDAKCLTNYQYWGTILMQTHKANG
jgi:hypothetical protein